MKGYEGRGRELLGWGESVNLRRESRDGEEGNKVSGSGRVEGGRREKGKEGCSERMRTQGGRERGWG